MTICHPELVEGWIPRSSRRMTESEFVDRLEIAIPFSRQKPFPANNPQKKNQLSFLTGALPSPFPLFFSILRKGGDYMLGLDIIGTVLGLVTNLLGSVLDGGLLGGL